MLQRMFATSVLAALLLVSPRVEAQSAGQRIVLRIDGLTNGLNGAATRTAEKDWLPAASISFEALTPGGGDPGAPVGRPTLEKFVLRKCADVSSAEFLARWMTSSRLPAVDVEYRRAFDGVEVVVVRYRLRNAVILASRSSVDTSLTSPAIDQLEFGFEQLEVTSYGLDSKGNVLNSRTAVFSSFE